MNSCCGTLTSQVRTSVGCRVKSDVWVSQKQDLRVKVCDYRFPCECFLPSMWWDSFKALLWVTPGSVNTRRALISSPFMSSLYSFDQTARLKPTRCRHRGAVGEKQPTWQLQSAVQESNKDIWSCHSVVHLCRGDKEPAFRANMINKRSVQYLSNGKNS